METIYMFDFDGTLVNCDKDHDIKTRYEDPKFISFIEPMYNIFNLLRISGVKFAILTNRTDKCIDFISSILKIEKKRIITRDYCLEESEIDIVIEMEKNNNLETFLERMDLYKINVLKIFSDRYNVVYYDDLYERFEEYKWCNTRHHLLILPPINGDR